MDLKTILVICALVIGALLVIGPYLSSLVNTVKDELAKSQSTPTPPQQSVTPTQNDLGGDSLSCLISLANGLDDKEAKDYLVDKVAPQIIRQRLTKETLK